MHEREGWRRGLAYVYRLLDTDRMGETPPGLGEIVAFARHAGFQGLNVTYPYKQAVIAHLDALSPEAEAVGAVNTVVFRDGRTTGHNTDMAGFAESFRRGLADRPHATVLLIGAGGAGAAVAEALLSRGVRRLILYDTDRSRAQVLAERIGPRATLCGDLAAAVAEADGAVNATPVGMAALPGTPLPPDLLRPALWVADIVYVPLETELLRLARARGCATMGGRGMAVLQAAYAFELFTGLRADEYAMARDFDRFDTTPRDQTIA